MNKIFLDMDGVIVNFVKGMCKMHGEPEIKEWLTPQIFGLTIKQFWAPCNFTNFWANLEWMPDGCKILRTAEKIGDVYILTAPTLSANSYSGKIKWIENNLIRYKHRTIICPCKELLAGNGILVDDSDKNVDTFRKAGGQAILVPRPWNSRFGEIFNLEAEINEMNIKREKVIETYY